MKAKPLYEISVAAARRILAEADVRHPRDIDIEAICARKRAMVHYGPMDTAHASIVRGNDFAVIRIDEAARDRPWGRWSAAHELAHLHLHALVDHYEHCKGGAERDERAWRVEKEADHCATELLMPEWLVQPLCLGARPTMDDVDRVARTFTMSFQASALRYVQLATAPCAIVLAIGGRIKWASESLSFPGKIVKGRALDRQSVAARVTGRPPRSDAEPREVPGGAWGAARPLAEQVIAMGPELGVMSWIVAEERIAAEEREERGDASALAKARELAALLRE